MTSAAIPAAFTTLLAPLVDGPPRACTVIGATTVSWHVHICETGGAEHDPEVSLISVQLPEAERLPCSVVIDRLPRFIFGDRGWIGHGLVRFELAEISSGRWIRPPQPRILAPRRFLASCRNLPIIQPDHIGLAQHALGHPSELLGRGPGLTPAGDDVLAAALVVHHALGLPMPGWPAPRLARATTPLSAQLLRLAARGYCCDRLASLMRALDRGENPVEETQRLMALGGTTGRAMLLGLRYAATQHTGTMAA
jgi:hypothetical protein